MHHEPEAPIARDGASEHATTARAANDVPDAGEGHKGPRTDVERAKPGTIGPGGRANVAPRVPPTEKRSPSAPGCDSECATGE